MKANNSNLPTSTKINPCKMPYLYISPYNSKPIISRNVDNNLKSKSKSFAFFKSPPNSFSPLISKLYCPMKPKNTKRKENTPKNLSNNKNNEIKEIKNTVNSIDKSKYNNKKYYKTLNSPKNNSFIFKNDFNIFECSNDNNYKYSTGLLYLKKEKTLRKRNKTDYSNLKTNDSKIYKTSSNEVNFQQKKINKKKQNNISLNNNIKSNIKSDQVPKVLKNNNKNENKITKQKKISNSEIETTNNITQENNINSNEKKLEANKEISKLEFQPDFIFQSKVKTSYEKYKKVMTTDKKKSNKNEKICDLKISPNDLNTAKIFEYKDHDIKKEKEKKFYKKIINKNKINNNIGMNIPCLISNIDIKNYGAKNNMQLNDKIYRNCHNKFYTQNSINALDIINDPIEEVEEAKEDSEMPNISAENKIFRISNYKNLSSNIKKHKSIDENKKINQTSIYDKKQIYRKNLLNENLNNNRSFNGHCFKYISYKNKINNENNKKTVNLKQYKPPHIKNDYTNLLAPLTENRKTTPIFVENNKILKNNCLINNNKKEVNKCHLNNSQSNRIQTPKEKLRFNKSNTPKSKSNITNNNYFEIQKRIIKNKNVDKNIDQMKYLYDKTKVFKKIIEKIDINKEDLSLSPQIKKYQSFKSLNKKNVKNFKNKHSKSITTSIQNEENNKKSVNNKKYLISRFSINNYLMNTNLKYNEC